MATKKVKEQDNITVARGLADIGCNDGDKFPVYLQRNDRQIKLELRPVSMDDVEKIKNAVPLPEPPDKVFTEEEKLRRKMDKLPLKVPDYDDKEYREKMGEVNLKIEWGILRAALGFDEDPTVDLEAWIAEAKKIFLPGDYITILTAVNKGTDVGRMVDNVSPF